MQPAVTIPPSGNDPKTSINPLIFAAYLAAVVALFVADVLTPRGATPVIGYCVIPLLAIQTRRRWFILGMMGLCTSLTWAAYFLEPPGAAAWVSVFERIMVTSVLWFTFVLAWQRMRALNALARQAQLLTETNRELIRSNQELDAFASVASHDIRGPLATTGLLASLLAKRLVGKMDRECTEWLSLIQTEVRQMNSVVESLLEYSRFSTDRLGVVESECEAILANVLDSLKADLSANGAEVTHDPLPTVTGDPVQLAVLFQNLIANAIKYRSAVPPKIRLSVASEQEGWKFSVRDNGVGIDPADSHRIFDLFQRGQGSHTVKGWGIGLATCKKIAELHGGRIWVESAPGSGSTFYFTITKRNSLSRATSGPAKETEQARSATA
jgi:signal transduction histidine kinase